MIRIELLYLQYLWLLAGFDTFPSRVQNASILKGDIQLALLNGRYVLTLGGTAFVLSSNTLGTSLLFAMMQALVVVLCQELAGFNVVGGLGGVAVQKLLPFWVNTCSKPEHYCGRALPSINLP